MTLELSIIEQFTLIVSLGDQSQSDGRAGGLIDTNITLDSVLR
jgi:hypothetical protein